MEDAFIQAETGKTISIVINKKFDEKAFQAVLSTFYGQAIQIGMDNLYQTYKICAYLKIETLLEQLNHNLVCHFGAINFYTVFQLSIYHKASDLVEKCESYLHESSCEVVKHDPILTDSYSRMKYPSSFVDLIDNTFAVLMRIVLKLSGMTNLRAYEVIQSYGHHKHGKLGLGERQEKVKFLLENIYDKYSLDSHEYQTIFHQNQFQQQSRGDLSHLNYNTEVESQVLNMTMDKSSQNLIQLIMSENYIYKKQIQEFKDENKSMMGEMITLKKEIGDTHTLKTELSMIQEQQEDHLQKIQTEMMANSHTQQRRIDTLE